MSYEWTDSMPAVSRHPDLEQHHRLAIIAACYHLESVRESAGEEPHFGGGFNEASPKNDAAHLMSQTVEAAIDQAVKATRFEPARVERLRIVMIAVRMAKLVLDHGGGEKGWAVFAATLEPPRRRARPLAGAQR